MNFCSMSAACGGARAPDAADPSAAFRAAEDARASLYCWQALGAHARTQAGGARAHSHAALLAAYCALAAYGQLLHATGRYARRHDTVLHCGGQNIIITAAYGAQWYKTVTSQVSSVYIFHTKLSF